MSWYAQTEEAQKHMEECEGCENCIWIEESAWAMTQYGTTSKAKPHPLKAKIIEKFNGVEID
jgi:sulfur transfer protein SufE